MKELAKHRVVTPVDEVLRRWWGYDGFRPLQRDVIDSVLSGRDTLALMPTGGGKSLTYQVPAMAVEGLTIVITPLIALMKDQVDTLRKRGIAAVAVHSGMDARRIDMALDNCVYGDVKLLYISPERLATDTFRLRLDRMNVSFVAVDEAHCISQWGYDFRPSYLRIAEIRKILRNATFLALTASATDLVANDIMTQLGFESRCILRSSFARPNLSYVVRNTEDKYEQLLRIISNVEGAGIVYMRTREGVEQLAERLRSDGHSASFYHAGLPGLERAIRQDEWQSGATRIMVATNAFGMGIDKSDVRFVVHYTMCDSLEAYYQEAGRAGRDGRRSYAVLLQSPDDMANITRRFEAEFPPIADIRRIYDCVSSFLQVAIGDGRGVSYAFNIYDFCHREKLSISKVESAMKLLEMNGYMTFIDDSDNPAKLMFMCSRDSLYKLNAGGNDMDAMLRAVLRLYDGLFTHFRSIDEQLIASYANLTSERVHDLLRMLWRMNIVRYIPAYRSPMVLFNEERLPAKDIVISENSYQQRYRLRKERFESMLQYATNDTACRSLIIERYFGDADAQACGVCDTCLRNRGRRSGDVDVEEHVVALLAAGELSVKELVAALRGDEEKMVDMVDKMIRDGKIFITPSGKLKINK